MPAHLLHATVRKLYSDAKYDWWELAEEAAITVDGVSYVIPAGFVSDGASVPFWVPDWLIPRAGRSFLPSLGHDWLCSLAIVPEETANAWYYTALQDAGVPQWQVELMYSYCETYAVFRYGELVKNDL
ncbi:DUF1353 domain-containing protein [Arsenicibacter rosenii]|uniref:DUF1353 domain-containing protein n=1 Tax=Arsenicibacter rosenii TaxID=1750698 RepID=A0A1S2VNN9_9BACT|nr:DUF1353 domain-containing protein [Arsenicibacter rosenii]OIN59825.1 hypothetical protein BLX24_08175 [Arsenicibacter rosenii]